MGLLDFVPIIGPAISAVGSIISGNNANDTNSANTAATNAANVALADKTNNFNAQQAQINRDYQTEMSNTAVQRRTADLTAAGINPILAAGSDASSPGGSSATGTMPTQQAYHSNPVNGAEAGINSAYQALQLKGALQKNQAEIANITADTLSKVKAPELMDTNIRAGNLSNNLKSWEIGRQDMINQGLDLQNKLSQAQKSKVNAETASTAAQTRMHTITANVAEQQAINEIAKQRNTQGLHVGPGGAIYDALGTSLQDLNPLKILK